MKPKPTLFLLLSIAASFLLFSCSDKGGMKTIFLPSESTASSDSDIVGAQCVASYKYLPRCSILTRGLLFYIQSPTARFVYCGADGFFHDISLTGQAGPQGPAGQNGTGITWLGELPSEPATSNINDAYYDTTLKEARIYTAAGWQILVQDGIGITWLGSFDSAPGFPNINDAYYDTVLCKSFIYTATGWQVLAKDGAQGPAGPAGQNGISIVWIGAMTDFPATKSVNNAFYHVTQGKAFIWDGTTWQILCQDGQSVVSLPHEITSFAFMKVVNPGLSEDVYGVISGADITVTVPLGTALTKFVASFAITGEYVTIGGDLQDSGVTVNDFSNPKVYTVLSEDGVGRNYVVKIINLTPTYTVTYDPNGADSGSVPIDSVAYYTGKTVTVLDNTNGLAKTGYIFSGWNTAVDGNGTTYSGGQTFAMGSANVTLYAKWTDCVADGFETGDTSAWIVTSTGSVPYSVATNAAHVGIYGLKIGSSSCGADCFHNYKVTLTKIFTTPLSGATISLYIYKNNSWGCYPELFINNINPINGTDTGVISLSPAALTIGSWTEVTATYNGTINSVTFIFQDITSTNWFFVDDISICGE